MGLYIHLVRLTDEGVRRVGEMKKLLEDNRKLIEKHGGRVVHAYSTLGRYDLVAVLDVPDDAAAMQLSAAIAAKGIFRPETLVATRLQEFAATVSK